MVNFRQDTFEGTLWDLLQECNKQWLTSTTAADAHSRLVQNINLPGELLPVRKFKGGKRGTELDAGQKKFLLVDNEPLAKLADLLIMQGASILSSGIANLLTKHIIPASWKCDVDEKKHGFRYFGVKSKFRDNGLKLAHIEDAAAGIKGTDEDTMIIRYLRSMSPLNIFLFPSPRIAVVTVTNNPSGISLPRKDLSEHPFVRTMALSFLQTQLRSANLGNNLVSVFNGELQFDNDWERKAKSIMVSVVPRLGKTLPAPKVSGTNVKATTSVNASACPKKEKDEAVSFDECIEILRQWRHDHPRATRLDGGSGSNQTHWFHIKIEGYTSPEHDFTSSRYGTQFNGTDYNGIVNFHGDTKTDKIDELIELYDLECEIQDILVPSATNEYRTMQEGKTQKPKFALRGIDGKVDGFYLYHDDWKPRGRRAA